MSLREHDRDECADKLSPGYCPNCECMRDAKVVDFGIGAYEYWGSRGRHVDKREVCSYCETEFSTEPEVSE